MLPDLHHPFRQLHSRWGSNHAFDNIKYPTLSQGRALPLFKHIHSLPHFRLRVERGELALIIVKKGYAGAIGRKYRLVGTDNQR